MEITALIDNLRHPDTNLRGPAAIALGKLGGASALDALLAAVGHEPDFYVREDITWALVRLSETAFDRLVMLLRDENPAVRHHAAHTLGKIGDTRATGALIESLNDGDPTVVSKAAFTLGLFGDARALPGLAGLLSHHDREVQAQTVTALERFGAAAVPYLTEALRDGDPQVRELAADVLGAVGGRESIDALAGLLGDEQWHVRFAAVTAIGHIGGPGAGAALQVAAEDPDKRVRHLAARLARRIRP